jgi:hypothetical protein
MMGRLQRIAGDSAVIPVGRRKASGGGPPTALLARTCSSKVSGAYAWPVFSAFRLLLEENGGR